MAKNKGNSFKSLITNTFFQNIIQMLIFKIPKENSSIFFLAIQCRISLKCHLFLKAGNHLSVSIFLIIFTSFGSFNRCEHLLFETMKIIKKYLKLNPRKIFYLKYSVYFVEKFWNVWENESSRPSCLYSHSSEPSQEMSFYSHYLCSRLSTLLQM